MNKTVRNSLLGGVATLALVAGASAPAFADSDNPTSHPKTLAGIQASAKVKTHARVVKLDKEIVKITKAKHVSDADRTTILGTLHADVTGMHAVEAKIQADTTVASAAADYATIFTTYRVYAVAIPQSHIAASADRLTGATIPRLTAAQTKLAAALAGPKKSKSTPALLADLADMSAKISAASSSVDGLAANALAVTPAGSNADHTVLSSERASLKSAVADLKKAAADGKKVVKAIR